MKTAANPTKLWKSATSWGRSVTAIRWATTAPIVPPTAMVAPIWVSTSTDGEITPIVAAIPLPIPMIPE